jgi:hypothetical protein
MKLINYFMVINEVRNKMNIKKNNIEVSLTMP